MKGRTCNNNTRLNFAHRDICTTDGWYCGDQSYTVYPKKYAHAFCFAVLCCGSTLTDFPISIRLTSLALWQSNDCPSASKATLMNMDKYIMWIHYERLHNHNKAKHNKTVCIFLGIYCTVPVPVKYLLSSGDTQWLGFISQIWNMCTWKWINWNGCHDDIYIHFSPIPKTGYCRPGVYPPQWPGWNCLFDREQKWKCYNLVCKIHTPLFPCEK